MNIDNIKEEIENIRNSYFAVKNINQFYTNNKIVTLLREALICYNNIDKIENILKKEKEELHNELDEVMKTKLKEINPNLSEEILNNIIVAYKRNIIIYPMDIFVLDDIVIHKEIVLDDFGIIYKIRAQMFEGVGYYYNIFDVNFILDEINFFPTPKKEPLSNDAAIYTANFISNSINSIYNTNIVKPIAELNTDNNFYGYKGLTKTKPSRILIYINKNFNDIGMSLREKKDENIKLCIQDVDNIALYYIHQSFKDDKPIWTVEKTNNNVWALSEEISKKEKNKINKLTKKL